MSTTLSYDELEVLARKLKEETITEDEKFLLLQALDKGLDEILEMMDEVEHNQKDSQSSPQDVA